MATIQIGTNTAEVARWLNGEAKKIAQAGRAALSKTVLQVQEAERKEIRQKFTIRRGKFLLNRVKIFQFPKNNNLVTRIGINENIKGSPLLLSQFEDGGPKNEGKRVAIPITGQAARKTFGSRVNNKLKIDKLNMKSVHGGRGRMAGDNGTFMAHSKGGTYVVFQRTGLFDVEPIYVLKKNVKVKKNMNFHRVAKSLAEEQLPKLFNRYLKLYIKG